jgi:hypothetical protein
MSISKLDLERVSEFNVILEDGGKIGEQTRGELGGEQFFEILSKLIFLSVWMSIHF